MSDPTPAPAGAPDDGDAAAIQRLTTAHRKLRAELAIHLYEQGRLSVGKAHELAGLPLWEFRQILGTRRIAPHFDTADLDRDLESLRGLDAG